MKKYIITSIYYKPNFGGVENSIFEISNKLINNKNEVIIIASNKDENYITLPDYEIIDGIKTYRFNKVINPRIPWIFKFFIDLFYANQLISKIVKEKGIDIIINRSLLTAAASIFIKKPLIRIFIPPTFSNFEYILAKQYQPKKYFKNILNYIFNYLIEVLVLIFSSKIIVFSNLMFKKMPFVSFFKRKVFICPPGVNCKKYYKTNLSKKTDLRKKFKINKDDIILICIGRLNKQKGYNNLIKNFMKIKNDKLKLLIVGDGPDKEDLINISLNRKDILFYPKTNNASELYNLADIFVMSSLYEPFGQTIIEAMSCGLPILAIKNDLTATNEIIKERFNGYFYKNNYSDFSITLNKFINLDYSKINEISKNNITKVNTIYTWENLIKLIV